jgi:hypothetical protein
MLTDPKLRSQVDAFWDKFWTGGLTQPKCINHVIFVIHRNKVNK